MRIAHKLFMFATMTASALVLATSSAHAVVTVLDEEPDVNHACSNVSLNVHAVNGGCHWEIQSEHHISLVVQTAGGPVTIMNCNWHLESQVGGNGVGYVTLAKLTNEPPPGTNPACTRKQCDEGQNGTKIPWPFVISEVGVGNEVLELAFCLEPVSDGAGTTCEVHLPLDTPASHANEVGNNATYVCEAPLGAISFQNVHLLGEADSLEDIEVAH